MVNLRSRRIPSPSLPPTAASQKPKKKTTATKAAKPQGVVKKTAPTKKSKGKNKAGKGDTGKAKGRPKASQKAHGGGSGAGRPRNNNDNNGVPPSGRVTRSRAAAVANAVASPIATSSSSSSSGLSSVGSRTPSLPALPSEPPTASRSESPQASASRNDLPPGSHDTHVSSTAGGTTTASSQPRVKAKVPRLLLRGPRKRPSSPRAPSYSPITAPTTPNPTILEIPHFPGSEAFVYGVPEWRRKRDGSLYLMVPVLGTGSGADDDEDGGGEEDGEVGGPEGNNDGDGGPDGDDMRDAREDEELPSMFGDNDQQREHTPEDDEEALIERDAEEQVQRELAQTMRDLENGDVVDDELFPPSSKTPSSKTSTQSKASHKTSELKGTEKWPSKFSKRAQDSTLSNVPPTEGSKTHKPEQRLMGVAESPLLSRITERSEPGSSFIGSRDDTNVQEKDDASPNKEDSSNDTDSDIDPETVARDRNMTDAEYRTSLNPLERDVLDFMNETPEERKRKRKEEDEEESGTGDGDESSDDHNQNDGQDPRRRRGGGRDGGRGDDRDSGRKGAQGRGDGPPARKKSKESVSVSSIWHALGDVLLPSSTSRSHQGQHRGAMTVPGDGDSSPSNSSSGHSSPSTTSSPASGTPSPSHSLNDQIRNIDPKTTKRVIRETKANEFPWHHDESSGSEPDSIRGWSPEHDFGPHIPGVDVAEGTRTRGPTSSPNFKEKVLEWGREDARFMSSQHGFEEGWVGVRPLGSGGYGRAGLWEKRSADGKVLDRVCIKQIKLPRKQYENVDEIPKEVSAHENLNQWHNPSIVGFRGHRRYPKSRTHRIYLEYCELGDLNRLIAKYRTKGHYFPEPFVWETFHHLAVALVALGQGPTPRWPNTPDHPNNELKTCWLHRDIKPDNVFLAAGESFEKDSVPAYPRAKLGDFGACEATGEEVGMPSNPWLLKGAGTEGYKPPEQKIPHNTDHEACGTTAENWIEKEVRHDWPKCSQHTNIWGVAACIYKLIKLTEVDHDFYRGIRSNGEVLPQITTRRSPEYSSELRDLVHQCLKFDPKDRPSLAEVLKRIESERLKFFKPWSEGAQMEEEARVRVSNDELNAWTYGPWRNEEKMPLSDYLESDRLPGQTAFDQKGPQAG